MYLTLRGFFQVTPVVDLEKAFDIRRKRKFILKDAYIQTRKLRTMQHFKKYRIASGTLNDNAMLAVINLNLRAFQTHGRWVCLAV